jgi:predicted TPR repeat methyltransferase
VTLLFQSSGDLIADRRYAFARDLMERGDVAAAADLFAQAAEAAPGFTAAWFALGDARARLGEIEPARDAFRQAVELDPADRHGASLRLKQLGAGNLSDMPPAYVRAVFDQYAERFDTALTRGLAYRGPELLLFATQRACEAAGRRFHFEHTLDLGCGTGLGGAAFRPFTKKISGMDLSGEMVRLARSKEIYDWLEVAEIMEFLARERDAAAYDFVLAADVFAYFGDLHALIEACASVMTPGGLLAFSVETHAGDGVVLGEKLRYAHSAAHVRAALAAAGLTTLVLEQASTRNEADVPVPGLIAVAAR